MFFIKSIGKLGKIFILLAIILAIIVILSKTDFNLKIFRSKQEGNSIKKEQVVDFSTDDIKENKQFQKVEELTNKHINK